MQTRKRSLQSCSVQTKAKKNCQEDWNSFTIAYGMDVHDTEQILIPPTPSKATAALSSVRDILHTVRRAFSPSKCTVAVTRIGDPLAFRHYLFLEEEEEEEEVVSESMSQWVIDSSLFQLWVLPDSAWAAESSANWFGIPFEEAAPQRGEAAYTLTLKSMQPQFNAMRARILLLFRPDTMGRFVVDRSCTEWASQLKECLNQGLINIVQEYSHNVWKPPVRIGSRFGRYLTNDSERIPTHSQARVRVQLHKSMMVPDTEPEAAGLEIGDTISFSDQETEQRTPTGQRTPAETNEDPPDLIVSHHLDAFFKHSHTWIVEGAREHINQFVCEATGMDPTNPLVQLVARGYAQYLVPTILPSFRFGL